MTILELGAIVAVQVFAAGVVWGQMRAEVKALRDQIAQEAKHLSERLGEVRGTADSAHTRVDSLLLKLQNGTIKPG